MKPTSNFTNQRVKNLLHRHILATLITINDPFWKKIIISRLTLRSDFHIAHLFYTAFGTTSRLQIQTLIMKKLPALKRLLSRKWPLKRLPQLVFVYDEPELKRERLWETLEKLNS